ncbi:hypothetical protein LO771_19805 [Streptacidiphilus sp. ASG 303]|uniref:hypothetical protein n=1 Tax=Streptacidiphilus sp. ASG 303 TaxID=2896847 RepID=UPI001E34D9EC|nr:hypothetical protein [Streptacidiphilus sp. ASG 303]MCD0484578.1 hypothetical protein [Streptacidiphilus sp. ASG 303]
MLGRASRPIGTAGQAPAFGGLKGLDPSALTGGAGSSWDAVAAWPVSTRAAGRACRQIRLGRRYHYGKGVVTESRLRRELREYRENAALERIAGELSGLFTGDGLAAEAVPAWVDGTLWGFWDISAQPAAALPDDSDPRTVDAWVEELVAGHGTADRIYVGSHLGILPWLECRLPAGGWMARIRQAIEEPWMFLTGSLDFLVVVAEAEYCHEAHIGHRPTTE